MAIKLEDLKKRVAGFTKSASQVNATDPTEKGTVSAPVDPIKDPKLPKGTANKSVEAQVNANIDTKPTTGGKNAPATKDGNAEDKQTKSANDRLSVSIQRLRDITKSASTSTTTPAKVEQTKQATEAKVDASIDMGPQALQKLASAIFETQEGIDTILPLLKKKAGQEAAISLLKQASDEYEAQVAEFVTMQKLAHAQAEQDAYYDSIAAEIIKQASSPEEAERMVKTASQHIQNRNSFKSELVKAAYDQSVEDAAEMAGAEEAGAEPALEGADGAPTIEQILMLLEQAVASGEISEEDAIAIAQSLMGDEAGEVAPEEGEVPMEPMPKEASVKDILKRLNK